MKRVWVWSVVPVKLDMLTVFVDTCHQRWSVINSYDFFITSLRFIPIWVCFSRYWRLIFLWHWQFQHLVEIYFHHNVGTGSICINRLINYAYKSRIYWYKLEKSEQHERYISLPEENDQLTSVSDISPKYTPIDYPNFASEIITEIKHRKQMSPESESAMMWASYWNNVCGLILLMWILFLQ